ncbi:MAG: bifunctional 5,10-methylenetetrahydrofolate dehydrogenase/5,10-methenyltetrahydrofolate cyclohydrolase [Oscillospiraceae bacterium]|nr:bifunctional 5,10-methylenetetrahydrofolate dehydrogenase/5,10-methenyltetrahydrofolate cyclohydrolase [Oscillospiraceae bacterium]
MAENLKGAPVAAAITEDLVLRTEKLKEKGIVPCLAILRVGERESDLSYERGALKRCEKTGIAVKQFILPEDTTQEDLMAAISEMNRDRAIHGCLMLRPLPKTLDEKAACAALEPKKDVDGITAGSMAMIYSGNGAGFAPCTAQSCMEMLHYYGVDVSGRRAAVIGRSLVIGRPAAMLLMQENATVTVCHTRTRNMPEIVREAEIVIVAAGKAEAIGAEYFREGQTVLDVGINWSEEKQKLVGDVDFAAAEPVVRAISPVPGGVGSVTTAVLCKHVIEAAEKAAD